MKSPEELKEKWSAILNSTTKSDCRAMLIEPMTSTCTCSHIKIGTTISDSKNLNPECPEHGYDSVWYNSPEQVKKREERSQRLRELYDARRKAQEKENEIQ